MEIRMNINGREVIGHQGQTVLAVARENGFEIPTLCHDDRVKMYGSCGVCVVEAEGTPKLLRSCSTMAADGMIILTDTERIRKTRRIALELLLSDHTGDCRPPCVLACPAQTDCQGYVGLIANGEYKEAVKLVKDKIPLPGAIGRVCPHPCEEACRRQLVEEPVSIANLKRFVADLDLASGEAYMPAAGAPTGKKVAIIGGGPGGLSAAYYLRQRGHAVDIYDSMPEMGGMLWYGIPEYRLPKAYLKREIGLIEKMGVTFRNNIRVGRDLSLDWLRKNFDAVIVAVGAWSSSALRCPGEELPGVIGGIDFLREVATGESRFSGKRVAVVGGGNTAMDCARTAVRLGAEKVYNIYRRTKNEMPAEEIEILEAEEEGVIFKNLTNPNEILAKDGRAAAVRLQIMELGEPDASGRRAPVPVEGKEELIEVDTVIVAIGQRLDATGLEALEQTKYHTISADESTFRTNLPGVFAIGDATNRGADIAISAIGEAKKAAAVVDCFLAGEEAAYAAPYLVTREGVTAEEFAEREKSPRGAMPHQKAEDRRSNFLEVNHGFSEEEARRDAARCLECGCHDYFECKLIRYANDYAVKPEKYDGKTHNRPLEDNHPFIHRNPDKCILCGLCVRICDEVVGSTALGLVNRGFDAIVKPALDLPLRETDCISCGQCVHACPTGALTETIMLAKQVPTTERETLTTCSFCSVGCRTKLTQKGGSLLRSLPAADRPGEALLCVKGRFGFGEIAGSPRITKPLQKTADGGFAEICFSQAYTLVAKGLQGIQAVHGKNSVGVAVSDRYTNEQIALIRDWAHTVLGTERVFSLGRLPSGLADVLGRDSSTADFDELAVTDLILAVCCGDRGVAAMKLRRAAQNGAGLLVLSDEDTGLDEAATAKYSLGKNLSLLRGVLKAVLERHNPAKQLPGYGETLASLADVSVSGDARAIADAYLTAKKAVILFGQTALSREAARLIGDIALASGKAFGARNGVIQLKPNANSQGLADLGVASVCEIDPAGIRGLIVFGEDIDLDAFGFRLDFLAVQELHLTETAKRADVALPGESFAETSGGFTSATGKRGEVRQALPPLSGKSTAEIVNGFAAALGLKIIPQGNAPARGEARLLPVAGGPPAGQYYNPNELYQALLRRCMASGIR